MHFCRKNQLKFRLIFAVVFLSAISLLLIYHANKFYGAQTQLNTMLHFECDSGRNGTSFNSSLIEYLADLNLLFIPIRNENEQPFNEFPQLISGFSSNHYIEGERLAKLINKHFPTHELIIYDLGLSSKERKNIVSKANVTLINFPFNKYPPFVSKLKQFRWKPLLIAEELYKHKAVFWMDSSVVWTSNRLEHLFESVRQKKLFPWVIFETTGHSNYAVTHPETLNYFNCSSEKRNVQN